MRIILLRGLARESAHWLGFPQQLKQMLGEQYSLLPIDFPGCGSYYQQSALPSISAMTDYARKEAAQHATKETYVVGISMGGMIALDWAQRFPEEVHGIVLINSSTGDQPIWWRLRPRAWLPILMALALPISLREQLILKNVSNRTDQYKVRMEQWLAIQQQHPVTRYTIIKMLLAAARFRPQQYCKPIGMMLVGDNDRFVSAKAGKALAKRFDWQMECHPQAGHDLPMDAPDWVCEKITNFIRTAMI